MKGRRLPRETRAYVATVTPNLDGSDNRGATVIATVDPRAWTRSSLFVGQQTSKPAVDPVPAEHQSSNASSAPIVRDVSAIVPQSNGLFVARASLGMAQ